MKKSIKLSILVITLAGIVNVSLASELMIFPAKGQSNETMGKDKFSCYGWAKGQTGFDPMKVPVTTTAPPPENKQSGGAAKGALGGAALGAIIGDSSSAAKSGAGAGLLIGGVRQRSANKKSAQQAEQWKQQEANNYANNRNQYNRAYTACLEGKGYTVK